MNLTSRLFITCIVSLLLILYAAMVYLAISTDYRLTVSSAKRQVVALSSVLEQHASRTMGEAESILDMTSHHLKEHRLLGFGAEIQPFLWPSAALMRKSPQIRNVFLVDAHGKMIANSQSTPVTPIYLGDREYYRYHTTHQDQASYISVPVQSRIDGTWLFTITRRVNRPDGSLRMIAGLAIETGYFSRFYQGLDLGGHDGQVSLIRSDGAILAGFPASEQNTAGSQ